jgi:endoribonuclease LACTB2
VIAKVTMNLQLPPLPEIERLSASVIRILGGNPGKVRPVRNQGGTYASQADNYLYTVHPTRYCCRRFQFMHYDCSLPTQGTNTYLVGRGPHRLLVDTGDGRPSWILSLKNVLSSESAAVDSVILTHWHPDHVNGVKDLLEFSPETRVYKNDPAGNQLDIEDGQLFRVEGSTLRAFHSPGHTTDHMALVLEEEDAMFTGDNVLGHGTTVFEDLAVYLSSLEKMRHQFTGRAYPGHGPVIEDGTAKILEYIQHRAHRENQIIQVLRSARGSPNTAQADTSSNPEGWSSMEIVKVIYKDVPVELHRSAEHGVLQVLRKLQAENRAFQDGTSNKWRINGRPTL